MGHISWARARTKRLLAIFVALVCFIALLSLDGSRYFPSALVTNAAFPWIPWLHFGFSAFVALIFLAVGTLVWLYTRRRLVAALLFGFSFAMMATFAVQTNAELDISDPLLIFVGLGASAAALLLFSVLLLVFPQNFLSFSKRLEMSEVKQVLSKQRRYYNLVIGLRGYVIILGLLCVNSLFFSAFYYSFPPVVFNWLNTIDNIYRLIALIGILITIIFSYFSTSSMRERQQRRLFVIGVILAVAPLLVLTFIPEVFPPLSGYMVSSQLSTIPVVIFPLALGYTILRYQVLVLDMYIRRAVAWIAGIIGLTFLGYLVVTLSSVLLAKNISTYVVGVVIAMALLSPLVWWLMKVATERIFFNEMLHYRKMIDSPDIMSSETFDLDEAAQLLSLAAVNMFETQEVCLFVLDEDTGCYRLYPPLKDDDTDEAVRRNLAQRVLKAAATSLHKNFDWLDANELLLKNVAVAHRPLLLSEALREGGEQSLGLGRYLSGTTVLDTADPLLVPVRAQGKMIGILVLGERGDYQQYAGPDFEAMYHLLARFSPVLEAARLYVRASKHVAILNTLYSANTMPVKDFETIEDVAVAYAKIAAQATTAGASVWLYNERDRMVHFVVHEGSGPHLVSQNQLMLSQEKDWTPWFYQGDSDHAWQGSSAEVPASLQQTPCFPFAWIPLYQGNHPLGLLILTYSRPHAFSQEEKRVLQMFAHQCAVALENARITIELRAAYEHQKELDHLKDQFIITASHELRTPLTAVLGYIELLASYNASLSVEARADFIAKAHRGCDELTLMVNNIMDASRVQIDVENVKLEPVSLVESVQHVLEILEAMMRREQRVTCIDIPGDMVVMADTVRLRQILLNLVGNALKYSPQGSNIEITCEADDEYVTTRVRDHGSGVPPADQVHLFERFVRLERDMNSPVRGAGLGLYICKQLVVAMGGRIWVESSGILHEGSTFTFTLRRSTVSSDVSRQTLEHQEV
jgi:signal transduction histidine kinase